MFIFREMQDNILEFLQNPIAQKAIGLGLATGLFFGYLVGSSLKKADSKKKQVKPASADAQLVKLWKMDHNSSMKRYLEEFGMFKQADQLKQIKHRTQALPDSMMLADPICTQVMALVASVANSKNHLEVGIYSVLLDIITKIEILTTILPCSPHCALHWL